jgi:hypothetical protein
MMPADVLLLLIAMILLISGLVIGGYFADAWEARRDARRRNRR